MADLPKTKAGLFARMRQWAQGQLIEEVPAEMERCEFDCRNLECTLGEWKTCENRLKSMRTGKG